MTLKQRSVLVKYDQYLWNLQNGKYYKVNDELRGPQVVQAWGPLERDQGQGLEPSGGGHTGHFLGPPLTLFGLQNPDWHQISHYWGGNPSNILWDFIYTFAAQSSNISTDFLRHQLVQGRQLSAELQLIRLCSLGAKIWISLKLKTHLSWNRVIKT